MNFCNFYFILIIILIKLLSFSNSQALSIYSRITRQKLMHYKLRNMKEQRPPFIPSIPIPLLLAIGTPRSQIMSQFLRNLRGFKREFLYSKTTYNYTYLNYVIISFISLFNVECSSFS
jgi:hypothetical protein